MRRFLAGSVLAILVAGVTAAGAAAAQQHDPVVRAVLFFSPTCPHCEQVINVDLPSIFETHGGAARAIPGEVQGSETRPSFYLVTNGTLEVLLVDVTVETGNRMYEANTDQLSVPESRRGVPRLVVAAGYMVGSREIPEQFPAIIAAGLGSSGIGWPEIAGIEDALASIPFEASGDGTTPTTVAEAGTILPDEDRTWSERFGDDPAANSLAVAVLVMMVASVVSVAALLGHRIETGRLDWLVPVLAAVGLAVAGYLAYVEASGADAVCGPVGDCNAVQQSEYARLLGVPIGVIGIVGYALMMGSWLVARISDRVADPARIGLFALATGGTAFSIYLTFLEPFVIGATCLWCLTSAVVVTCLLWLAAGPGWSALRRERAARAR